MAKFRKFLLGAVLGAIAGAGLSIILAPYSGPRLREEIETYYKRTADDIRMAALQRRSELELQLQDLRSPQKIEHK
ncbi:MAG: YtxH domain-containing protein [Chloroflexi bacterium]|nr:YtxH domain-containing protein [Chloroflexota bacterium]